MSPSSRSVPPTVPARRADARRSRQLLIAAAADLLGTHSDTSVDAIAELAGVGRTTAFRHFPTRADLVRATWSHLVTESTATLEELRLADLPPREALDLLVASITGLSERWPLLFRGERPALDDPDLLAVSTAPEALITATVQRAAEAGVLRRDLPPALLSEAVFAIVQAVLINGLRGDRAVTAAISLLIQGAGAVEADHGR